MIKPINGMLLVKELQEGEEITNSGLIISAMSGSRGPKRGKIVAVGSPETNHFTGGFIPMDDFEVDSIVLYPNHSGEEVKEDGEEYLLIHYKHIMAKIIE